MVDMFKDAADDITFLLIKDKIVDIENREIYAYGLEALLLNFANILTAFLISVISGTLLHFVVFMLVFVPTRMFTGGYHAKTSESCYIKTTIIYALTVFLAKYLSWIFKGYFAILLLVITVALVIISAPVEHKNNPLSTNERRKNRIIAIVLTVIDSLVFITLYYMTLPTAASVLILMTVNSILMMIGLLDDSLIT